MRAYNYAPANELKLTRVSEIPVAIKGLKIDKASGSNGVRNWALRHLPKIATTFITLSSAGNTFHQHGNTLARYPF
jgi:hypothetical protein